MTHDEYKNLLIAISLERLDVFLADLDFDCPDQWIKKRANKRVKIAVHIAEQLLDEIDDVLQNNKETEDQFLYNEKVRDKMNYILENN